MRCPSLPLGVFFLFAPSPGSVTGVPGSEMPFPSIRGCEEGSGHWVQHGSSQSRVQSQQCDVLEGNCQPWRAAVLRFTRAAQPRPLSLHQVPPSIPIASLGWLCPPRPFQGQRGVGDTPAQAALGFLRPRAGIFVGEEFPWPISVLSDRLLFSLSPEHPHPLHSTAAARAHA